MTFPHCRRLSKFRWWCPSVVQVLNMQGINIHPCTQLDELARKRRCLWTASTGLEIVRLCRSDNLAHVPIRETTMRHILRPKKAKNLELSCSCEALINQTKCPQNLRRESLLDHHCHRHDVSTTKLDPTTHVPRAALNQPMLDKVTLLSQPKASRAANYASRLLTPTQECQEHVRCNGPGRLLDCLMARCTMISATSSVARMQ